MKLLAMIGVLAALVGCTSAQRETRRIESESQRVGALAQTCLQGIERGSSYGALRDKLLPLTPHSQPSLEQLADTTKPTPAEIRHLFALHAEFQTCRKMLLENVGGIHPSLVSLFAEAFSAADARLLRLVRGQVTWGDFIREDAQGRDLYVARLNATFQAISQNLANAHAYEISQRQRAFNTLAAWSIYQQQIYQQQQLIHALNRPVVTSCGYVGPRLHCTTM